MSFPTLTTFRNIDASEAAESLIRSEAEKLGQYFERITSCRVIAEAVHRHELDAAYHVRIELSVPGKELVVAHEPASPRDQAVKGRRSNKNPELHHDLYAVIRDAFRTLKRQLQDFARRLRHDVKTHTT